MSANAIARRYAKALVQLGAEEGAVDKFYAELSGFDAVLAAHGELRSVFTNPAFGAEAKRNILQDLIAKLSVSPTVANFLLLLLDKHRLGFLGQILTSYGTLADELSGVVRPTLVSAMPLGEAKVAEIKGALEKMTGRPREHLEFTVWFLVQKKFIQRADNSLLVITADGVEHLEQNYQTNLQNKRLRARND